MFTDSNRTSKTARLLAVFFWTFYLYYSIYKYVFSFNYLQTWVDGHYLLLQVSCLFLSAILCLISLESKQNDHKFSGIFSTVFLLLLLIALLSGSEKYNFHNEVFCNTVCIFCLFLSLKLSGKEIIQKTIFPLALLFFCGELLTGYSDLIKNYKNDNLHLLVKGHLENSGIYSIYLAAHLPLVKYYTNKLPINEKAKRFLSVAIYIAVAVLLVITQSRAAVCGTLVFLILSNIRRQSKFPKRVLFIALSFLSLGLVILGLFFLKPASAVGRLNVWKITATNFSEYWIGGKGYGLFHKYYPLWQMDYFSKLPANRMSEITQVDEVYIAYNEPLQLIVEIGIIGFLCAVLLLIVCFLLKRKQIDDNLSISVQYVFVIIFVAGLFSYPLHVNAILVLVSACAAYLFSIGRIGSKLLNILLRTVVLGVLLVTTTKAVNQLKAIREWKEVANDVLGSDEARLKKYQQLYPNLKQNAKFLLDYGSFLFSIQNPLAIVALEESRRQLVTVTTLENLAQSYENIGKIDETIGVLSQLCNLIPYKFGYKNKLLDLCILKRDTRLARKVAIEIVIMPVKKEDELVRKIKQKANVFLKNTYGN